MPKNLNSLQFYDSSGNLVTPVVPPTSSTSLGSRFPMSALGTNNTYSWTYLYNTVVVEFLDNSSLLSLKCYFIWCIKDNSILTSPTQIYNYIPVNTNIPCSGYYKRASNTYNIVYFSKDNANSYHFAYNAGTGINDTEFSPTELTTNFYKLTNY